MCMGWRATAKAWEGPTLDPASGRDFLQYDNAESVWDTPDAVVKAEAAEAALRTAKEIVESAETDLNVAKNRLKELEADYERACGMAKIFATLPLTPLAEKLRHHGRKARELTRILQR